MAWEDLAKVGQLLASLGELSATKGLWQSAAKKAKGAGKGLAHGNDKGKGKGTTRHCQWQDCKAGVGKQATWGGVPNCHCCHRPFSRAPPVEMLAD